MRDCKRIKARKPSWLVQVYLDWPGDRSHRRRGFHGFVESVVFASAFVALFGVLVFALSFEIGAQ